MDDTDVVKALAALAHAVRLRIFRALVVSGSEGLTPGVMAEGVQVPAATLSFHLKELVNAGLVTQRRHGRHLIYCAGFERMNAVLAFLTANCCLGEACAPNDRGACGR